MNKAESVAFEHLKSKYPTQKFLYKKVPTFITNTDAFEVKRLYNTKIIINQKQKDMLEKINPIVLLVEANSVIDTFKWSDVENKPYEVVFNVGLGDSVIIRIPSSVKSRLIRYGEPGEKVGSIIEKMLDVVESEIKKENY